MIYVKVAQHLRTKPATYQDLEYVCGGSCRFYENQTLVLIGRIVFQFDPKKAEKYSQQLPTLDELTKNVNEEEIESWTFGSKLRSKVESSPGTPRTDTSDKPKKRKKKKKSKPPLPEGVYLDPERWLPKYERTGYKKKRDRRNKEQIKGSQGSSTHLSDAL